MGIHDIANLYPSKPIVNPTIPQTPSVQSFMKRQIEYVKGYDGAAAYPLAADSSAILPDADMPVIWVIMTDSNGNKTMVKGYNLGDEYIPPKPVTMEDLMAEMKAMNERLMRVEEGKNESNRGHDFQSKSYRANGTANERNNAGSQNWKSVANAKSEQSTNATGS